MSVSKLSLFSFFFVFSVSNWHRSSHRLTHDDKDDCKMSSWAELSW